MRVYAKRSAANPIALSLAPSACALMLTVPAIFLQLSGYGWTPLYGSRIADDPGTGDRWRDLVLFRCCG